MEDKPPILEPQKVQPNNSNSPDISTGISLMNEKLSILIEMMQTQPKQQHQEVKEPQTEKFIIGDK